MQSKKSILPDWLAISQDYAPARDSDAFIDRSIKSFLGMLSILRRRTGSRLLYGQHLRLRLCALLILIILISLSRNVGYLALVASFSLVILSLLPGRAIARVLASALGAGCVSLLILLPSLFWGNSFGIVLISLKILITVSLLKMLTETSDWTALSGALAGLHVSGLLILVLEMTLRYLTLLGEFSLNMLIALRLRSVGHNTHKSAALSGIAGTLFLKSRQMGSESLAAMECRCFTGDYHPKADSGFGPIEISTIILTLVLGGAFFLLQ